MVAIGQAGGEQGKKAEGIEKYRLVVTKWSWGYTAYKVQHREDSQ